MNSTLDGRYSGLDAAGAKLEFRVSILVLLVILGGCTERQLTVPTPQMDAPEDFWVRVLLYEDITGCRLTSSSSFRVRNEQPHTFEAQFLRQSSPIDISICGAGITVGTHNFSGREVIILPAEPYVFKLNGSGYRGKLKLIVSPEGKAFDAINLVPLEPYLAGVVGAEMPSYWEPEALEAQAIAARTYCLYIKKQFGRNRSWDVTRTQANQVYLGLGAESPLTWRAVKRTHGRVLVCTGPDAGRDIFPAYYSSACGGHTENSKHVFGDCFEPLTGVQCPYCRQVAKPRHFYWPTVQFDKADVTARLLGRYPKLEQLGKIEKITPTEQSDYSYNYEKFSRLTKVKLVGSTGKSDFLRAEDLRLAIDPTGRKIKSTICKTVNMPGKWAFLFGRGWGHGVGMCQHGAEAMARQGKKAEQILSYYYPGSRIERIY